MSAISPLIAEWIKNKLPWRYVYSPLIKGPLTIPPGGMIKVTEHKFPEGVFIMGGVGFDSSMCGIRMEAGPNLDTERTFTIGTLILMNVVSPNVAYWVSVPPTAPVGFYTLFVPKEWAWTEFFRLWIYNDDTVEHTCLGGGYTLAVLEKARPASSRETLEAILKSQEELVKIKGGYTV